MAEKSKAEKIVAVIAFYRGAALLAVGAFQIWVPLGFLVTAAELIILALAIMQDD